MVHHYALKATIKFLVCRFDQRYSRHEFSACVEERISTEKMPVAQYVEHEEIFPLSTTYIEDAVIRPNTSHFNPRQPLAETSSEIKLRV